MEKKKQTDNISANDEEMDIMPAIELVECERTAYIKGMEDYLQRLKSLAPDEALREAERNLKDSHIIQENGEFTERYFYSRIYAGQKG